MITLLKFYADWCGPCRAMIPTMDVLKDEFAESVVFVDVNIDDNPQLRAQYHIRSIPALVLEKDGVELARKTGSANRSELETWIKEYGS